MQIDDENQKKQLTLPNTDTTFNLNNKENSLKIPKYEEPEELEQPEQLSLIPQNEIDKIIIDTINS
ncbi:MAG: hypothetical protein LBC61_00685 [Candidatus Peribacteria bacterium]|jgi:hypothetical protein|nr:hypothetical protein [Candidatus Peribacteria bacterium]